MERWTEHHPKCSKSIQCDGPWNTYCNCPPFWPRPAAYHNGEMALGKKEVAALVAKSRDRTSGDS